MRTSFCRAIVSSSVDRAGLRLPIGTDGGWPGVFGPGGCSIGCDSFGAEDLGVCPAVAGGSGRCLGNGGGISSLGSCGPGEGGAWADALLAKPRAMVETNAIAKAVRISSLPNSAHRKTSVLGG